MLDHEVRAPPGLPGGCSRFRDETSKHLEPRRVAHGARRCDPACWDVVLSSTLVSPTLACQQRRPKPNPQVVRAGGICFGLPERRLPSRSARHPARRTACSQCSGDESPDEILRSPEWRSRYHRNDDTESGSPALFVEDSRGAGVDASLLEEVPDPVLGSTFVWGSAAACRCEAKPRSSRLTTCSTAHGVPGGVSNRRMSVSKPFGRRTRRR
jgi:hypothetical protein